MIRIERFKPEHLQQLKLQPAQQELADSLVMPGYAQMLQSQGALVAINDLGSVVACCGIMEVWQGRGIAWALLGSDAGKDMRAITRACNGYFMAAPYRRIEAWVNEGFEEGMRWMRLLGFEQETPVPMRGFRPDGGASYLFARVN